MRTGAAVRTIIEIENAFMRCAARHIVDVAAFAVIDVISSGIVRVLQKPVGCQPCYERDCPLRHHRCMTEIAVDDVFSAAVGLFNEIDGKVESDVRVL